MALETSASVAPIYLFGADFLTMYAQRIALVRAQLKKWNTLGMLITNPAHIFYLTGFSGLSPEEREATVLITAAEANLYLPRMYQEHATTLETVQQKRVACVIDVERDGLMIKWVKTVPKGSLIAIEEGDLTIEEYEFLKKETGCTFLDSRRFLESLRLRKDAQELDKIRTVVAKTDAVFNDLVAALRATSYTNYTELDIADLLRVIGRKHDLLKFAFEPIVACGAGGSEPHYKTANKKLRKNEMLLMDFGFTLDGYNSDITRTIALGKPTDRMRNMYDLVLACNNYSLKLVKPGVNAGDLHVKAVEFFAKNKVAEHFIHGLGHGIGLEVHEEPFFRLNRETILQAGMAVTIEPGLYFPGEFGIRVEDYVIVTPTGHEVVSKNSPKELIVIP